MLTDLRTQTSPYVFCESFSYTGLSERKRHRTAYIYHMFFVKVFLTQACANANVTVLRIFFVLHRPACYIGESKRHRIFFVKVSKFLTQVLEGLLDDANVAVLYLWKCILLKF